MAKALICNWLQQSEKKPSLSKDPGGSVLALHIAKKKKKRHLACPRKSERQRQSESNAVEKGTSGLTWFSLVGSSFKRTMANKVNMYFFLKEKLDAMKRNKQKKNASLLEWWCISLLLISSSRIL